jgi:hypothetical protein
VLPCNAAGGDRRDDHFDAVPTRWHGLRTAYAMIFEVPSSIHLHCPTAPSWVALRLASALRLVQTMYSLNRAHTHTRARERERERERERNRDRDRDEGGRTCACAQRLACACTQPTKITHKEKKRANMLTSGRAIGMLVGALSKMGSSDAAQVDQGTRYKRAIGGDGKLTMFGAANPLYGAAVPVRSTAICCLCVA